MSTYNKKLPSPQDFCWMDVNRNGRTTGIVMPFGGVIQNGVSYFGWKQPSFSYSYQPQYYVIARLTPSKQLDTGASESKTAWKWVGGWTTNPAKPDVQNWGVTMDKKNRYYRYANFGGKSLMTAGSYDMLKLVFRVRTVNSKAKQHGAWASRTLTVKCRPNVQVHKIVALADGGFRMFLNTNGWMRGGSTVILNDVRHEGGEVAENKGQLVDEMDAIGDEEAADYPFVEFAGSGFDSAFMAGESVTLANCVFRTCDGVDATLDGTYAIDPVSAIIDAPTVGIERDEDTGAITATFSKSDTADDWDSAEAWMDCEVRGKAVRFDPVNSSGSNDSARTYTFHPPLDSPLTLRFGVTNNLGGAFSKTYTKADFAQLAPIPSNGRVLVNYTDGTDKQPTNGRFYGSKVAAMNYEVEFSTDATREADVELPHGRKRPVAFLAEGLKNTISIKGSIGALLDGSLETVPFSGYYDWLAFQEQQGLVLLRMPETNTYQAVCTKTTINQEDEFDETKTIDLSFEEVDI